MDHTTSLSYIRVRNFCCPSLTHNTFATNVRLFSCTTMAFTKLTSTFEQRPDSDEPESKLLLLGQRTNKRRTAQRWQSFVIPVLTITHVLFTIFGYGLGRYCGPDGTEPISPWMLNVDRSYHDAIFNAFGDPNAFTKASGEAGGSVEDRWIEAGAYGE